MTALAGNKECLDAVTRTAQYVTGLTSDADVWPELCRVLTTFLRADLAAFIGRQPAGGMLVHHCAGPPAACAGLAACWPQVGQVAASGFLATDVVALDGPFSLAFLPLTVAGDTVVMVVGHGGEATPSRDALNVYLAVAGLFETTLARLGSKHLLEHIADNVPQVLFQLVRFADGQLRFTYVSRGAAAVLGVAHDSLMRHPGRLFDPLPADKRISLLQDLAGQVRAMTVEVPWRHPDGGERVLEFRASGVRAGGGTMIWDGTVADVSAARRAAEERLVQATRLKTALLQTIQAVSLTVEKRDPYTAGHQRQVGALGAAIARAMGLPDDRVEGVYLGGLIHDIGKVAVPSELLSKPSQLSEIEMALIRTHPAAGYDIVKDVDFPWPVALMVRHHHERLDGSGYPDGLRGDQICLEARILAVADVVDAVAAHRPYRPSRGLRRAVAELRRGAGTRYDPEVVRACIRVLRQPSPLDHQRRRPAPQRPAWWQDRRLW